MHHRTQEFSELYSSVVEKAKEFSGASEVVVLTGSGTLANESMLGSVDANKLLVCSNGVFGKRLYEISSLFHKTDLLEFKDGEGINYERVNNRIELNNYDAIALVENETSTACLNDVNSIAKDFSGKLFVDSVSVWPIGKISCEDVSIMTSATQKAIGIMPGLSFVLLSEQGKGEVLNCKTKRSYYADLARHITKYKEKKQTLTTPAVTLLHSLAKSLNEIDKIGLDCFKKRHTKASAFVRKCLTERGFQLLAEKGFYSPTVTAFLCKDKQQRDRIKQGLDKKGFQLAAGKGTHKDTGLRIATMGFFEEEQIKQALELIETLA